MNKFFSKKIFIALISLAVFLYFSLNIFSYFDPLSFCRIKIHQQPLSGNRSTIKEALRYIKRSDPSSYAMVCKYVKDIGEKNCMSGDARVDASFAGEYGTVKGCYVRGTKFIYLKPNKNNDRQTVAERAKNVIHLAAKSENFWQKY